MAHQPQPVASKPRVPIAMRIWLGLLILFGLVAAVTHLGDIEHFVALMQKAEPQWLALALLLQLATYFSLAVLWQRALLLGGGVRLPLRSLVPLGLAKLFSDQAMPTGGMSGTAFLVAALHRRGVAVDLCMAISLLSLVAYYAAYLLFTLASVALLWLHHAMQPWIVIVTLLFGLVAVAIPAGALWLQSHGKQLLPRVVLRIPGLKAMLQGLAQTSGALVHERSLLLVATALHGSVFLLDSLTLWVMLQAIGQTVSFWVVLPSFILASVVATLGPVPLGLGTFEASCVTMLGALGVPIEAALTATLLLRGLTLWLPMLPGLWLTRRILR
ncbi:MAG TPA: lysylphosphatidylglycerol synthase transmembrane domain-containing protein [Gammaproteobacteria bacterium]